MATIAAHERPRSIATLIGLGAIALWATLAPLSLLARGVPPFLLTGAAFLLGGCLGLLVLLVRGRGLRAAFAAPTPAWLLGVGGFFGYHLTYFLAFRHLPAVEALLIINLWPLLIVLFSSLATGERLRPPHVLGAVAGLAGATVLVLGQPSIASIGRSGLGYALAIAAALIWSSYSVLNRRFAADASTEAVTGFCLVTGALGLAAHVVIEPPTPFAAEAWVAVLLLGMGPVGLAFYLWDHGTKRGDLRLLGSASYAAPLIGTCLLFLMGEGQPSLTVLLAGLLIIGGAALAAIGARAQPSAVARNRHRSDRSRR